MTTGVLLSIGTWEFATFYARKTDKKHENLNSFLEADQVEITVKRFKRDEHLGNKGQVTKFTLVNIYAVIFGMDSFYLALLSKPEVMELETIPQFDILSLIGLGLGIAVE